MNEPLKEIIIYTDGACTGNPGPGGYGVVLLYNQHRKELSGGYRLTTNNRMEMIAAIAALQALKDKCLVTLHTDSKYLVDAVMQGWAKKWKTNGWMRNKKEEAKNPDLWAQLLDLCDRHQVKFVWVRGHAGIEENECCDRLAVSAARQRNLPADLGYENQSKSSRSSF
jgi:ribonuclease HI